MSTRWPWLGMSAMALASLTISCLPKTPLDHASSVKGHVGFEDNRSTRWPDPNNIPVCWEKGERPEETQDNASANSHARHYREYAAPKFQNIAPQTLPAPSSSIPQLSEAKKMVQDYVTSEMKRAGLTLTGWGDCSESSKGIRASIGTREGYGNFVTMLGRDVDGVKFGLNLDHSTSELNGWPACKKDPSICIKSVGLHEFGHAIGLAHEQDRVDFQSSNEICKFDPPSYIRGHIGDYDPDSIMNYCMSHTHLLSEGTPRPIPLSPSDIKTLRLYYGLDAAKAGSDTNPIAFISKTTLNTKQITLKVFGQSVTKYKFVVGDFKSLNCKSEASYGAERDISQPITIDAAPSHNYKVCVVGGNDQGWQDYELYSSLPIFDKMHSFMFDWYDPAADTGGYDPPKNFAHSKISVRFGIKYSALLPSLQYTAKIAPNTDCSSSDGYRSIPDGLDYDLFDLSSMPDGPINLCVVARTSEENAFDYTKAEKWIFSKKSAATK